MRTNAALSLGEAKDHEALELLIDVAKDKKEEIELRKRAVIAMGLNRRPEGRGAANPDT